MMGGRSGKVRHELRPKKTLQQRWLKAYVTDGTVTGACAAAGIHRTTFYRWRELDEEFARQVADAEEEATESLEQVAIKRARARSDTLLIFLLKARRPEVYRERYDTRVSGDLHATAAMIDPTALKHMTTSEVKTALKLFRKMLGEKDEETT